MALEQASDHDDQGKTQEQSADLPPRALRHRYEQRVADRDRIGELDQPVGPPRQEHNVRRTEDGKQIEHHHADEPGECLGLDLIASSPKKNQPGNAGGRGRERDLGRDLDGVVGVEAEQEQANQGAVQPVEATCAVCRRGFSPPAGDWSDVGTNFPVEGVVHHPSVSKCPISMVLAASEPTPRGHLMTTGSLRFRKNVIRGLKAEPQGTRTAAP